MLGSLKFLDGYDREDKEAEEEEVTSWERRFRLSFLLVILGCYSLIS